MRKLFLILIFPILFAGSWFGYKYIIGHTTGAPPYADPQQDTSLNIDPHAWIRDWVRPDGPAKVAIQVGHWQNDDLPEELQKLRNSDGAAAAGFSEWEVNLAIAEEIKKILEKDGITVEILPATVPPRYWADVFIAIHADGNLDTSKSGFKFAGPWRDLTGKSENLVDILTDSYQEATGIPFDDNISRNMRGYYAFAWWRYDHAVHPMTTAVIAETGFLTSEMDRRVIVENPKLSAEGMAKGLIAFLKQEGLLI